MLLAVFIVFPYRGKEFRPSLFLIRFQKGLILRFAVLNGMSVMRSFINSGSFVDAKDGRDLIDLPFASRGWSGMYSKNASCVLV